MCPIYKEATLPREFTIQVTFMQTSIDSNSGLACE
jgi:hypothetical protein